MRTTPRSAKASGSDFPYASSTVCYIEITKDGVVTNGAPDLEALKRAMNGETRIYAVWPGSWRSDLFEIDDIEACAESLGLRLNDHKHDVVWTLEPHHALDAKVTTHTTIFMKCECSIKNIKGFADDMYDLLGWDVRVSQGWSGGGPRYVVPVSRKSLASARSADARISHEEMQVLTGPGY